LSAAARAAMLDKKCGQSTPGHVLLEGFSQHAKTIQYYQRGKHVMAEPGFLDLRSDLRFDAGSRERILQYWQEDYRRAGINLKLNAEVKSVSGRCGNFVIQLANAQTLCAEKVVLAIGTAGNPIKLGVPGEECPGVQYQLDDPKEYANETIIVVGAGDAAVENALALSEQNDVIIVNQKGEFSRPKEANLTAVVAAIADPTTRLDCFYNTRVREIAENPRQSPPLSVLFDTPEGRKSVACHRVIARLGSTPARGFVESMGITFPNSRKDAVPELNEQYESNVAGIYIVGSLAGYPLIKQAMNQGYDVAEFIYGNTTLKPVDHQLLEWQFSGITFFPTPDQALGRCKARVPMFRELNALGFRELVIESAISVAYPRGPEYADEKRKIDALIDRQMQEGRKPRATRIVHEGEVLYEPGEFGTSFFTIVNGSVKLESNDGSTPSRELSAGNFFGEMSLLSGRPRTERAVAGAGCVLVETPRRTMVKLMNSNEEVRRSIDEMFMIRELQRCFAPSATVPELQRFTARVGVRECKAGDIVFTEGEAGESLFIVRSGGITLTRKVDSRALMVAEVGAGGLIGELAVMGDPIRHETARASRACELLEVKRREFLELVRRPGAPLDPLRQGVSRRFTDMAKMQIRPQAASMLGFLMGAGLGEATDVLVIDESLCVGCDNCEKACAETHGGVSRLDRKAGSTFAHVHIPVACRHCEQPHCMKDCPPNAIRRSPSGEVYIDDSCIGCRACEKNCPYDAIQMVHQPPTKPSLLTWLQAIVGRAGGEVSNSASGEVQADRAKAIKCDACIGVKHGPACVKACPTGAAIRIGPERYIELIEAPRE